MNFPDRFSTFPRLTLAELPKKTVFQKTYEISGLEVWRGDPKNVRAAQQALYDRAKCNCAARYGKYSPDMAPKG